MNSGPDVLSCARAMADTFLSAARLAVLNAPCRPRSWSLPLAITRADPLPRESEVSRAGQTTPVCDSVRRPAPKHLASSGERRPSQLASPLTPLSSALVISRRSGLLLLLVAAARVRVAVDTADARACMRPRTLR